MKLLQLLLLSSIALSCGAWADDGTGLQISASVDLVGQAGLKGNSGASNKLSPRGVEFMLAAPADHLFDGVISFAAHDEGGIPMPELHEGWIGSTKLIPRSRFRLGQYFLGVGRLNQFHQHDWPFITAPKVQNDFFAFEGVLDTGLEYSYLLPLPFFLEITGGVTNGFIFGHDHSAGKRPMFPTHYVRTATFFDMPSDGGAQLGLNYLGRRDDANTRMRLLGVDFTSKWKAATVTDMLIQAEVWHRSLAATNALGLYVYPQKYVGGNLFLGFRVDYFSTLNLQDALGRNQKNYEISFVPTLTYRSSEFATFRLAYNFKNEYLVDRFLPSAHMVEGQAVFIIGAHPAHDF